MIIVGDVHGKVLRFNELLKKNGSKGSIQLGDFGYQSSHDWHINNLNGVSNKVVFGNHDWYPYLDKLHSTGDTEWIPEIDACTFRGALSINKHELMPRINYFENEELAWDVAKDVIELIKFHKPKVILSHTCPVSVRNHFFNFERPLFSVTEQAMQILFHEYQPDMWVFGHFHESKNEKINGTRFICLDELETLTI